MDPWMKAGFILYVCVSLVVILFIRNCWYRHRLVYLYPFFMVVLTALGILFLKYSAGDGNANNDSNSAGNYLADALTNSFLIIWSAILGATVMYRGDRAMASQVTESRVNYSLALISYLCKDLKGVAKSLASQEPNLLSLEDIYHYIRSQGGAKFTLVKCTIVLAVFFILVAVTYISYSLPFLVSIGIVVASFATVLATFLAMYPTEYRLLSLLTSKHCAEAEKKAGQTASSLMKENVAAVKDLPITTRYAYVDVLGKHLDCVSLYTNLLRAAVLLSPIIFAWLYVSSVGGLAQANLWHLLLATSLYLGAVEMLCRSRRMLMRLERLHYCLVLSLETNSQADGT